MNILPRWLALFPSLEQLECSLWDEDILGEEVVGAVVERCPTLKRIQTRSLQHQARV